MNAFARFGPIMQLAFVPGAWEAALAHWLRMGAGPFFLLEHIQMTDVLYRGRPTAPDFSVMLGYWGDLQIELIVQHDRSPSIYREWGDMKGESLHHTCIVVDDMAPVRALVAEMNATIAQEGKLAGGGEAIYIDFGAGPGTMLEVLKSGPGGREFFAMMQAAHRDWDGATDPVRKLG